MVIGPLNVLLLFGHYELYNQERYVAYCSGVRSSTEVAAAVARRYRSSDQIEAAREPDINRSTRDCTWETLVGDIVCGGRRDRLNKKTFPHTLLERRLQS